MRKHLTISSTMSIFFLSTNFLDQGWFFLQKGHFGGGADFLVGKNNSPTSTHDSKNVIIDSINYKIIGIIPSGLPGSNIQLDLVDGGGIKRPRRLDLFWLQGEAVSVDAEAGAAGVVLPGLDVIEVLGWLFFEAVHPIPEHFSRDKNIVIGLGRSGPGEVIPIVVFDHVAASSNKDDFLNRVLYVQVNGLLGQDAAVFNAVSALDKELVGVEGHGFTFCFV